MRPSSNLHCFTKALFTVVGLGSFGCGSSDAPQAAAIGDAAAELTQIVPEAASQGDETLAVRTDQPICSTDGWCWEKPSPQGNDLFAMFGSDPTHVWIGGELGTVLGFDGTAWTSAPDPGKANVRGIWASAVDDVWAVGDRGTILHYDGATWSHVAYPEGDASADAGQHPSLFGLTGTSSSDLWAVGEGGAILHFDGAAWTSLMSATTSTLRAVFASATDDAWAVGDAGVALHFDGAKWSDGKSGLSSPLYAISGTSKSDLWAVGAAGTIAHYDGTAWTSSFVDRTTVLRAVQPDGAEVWAAGDDGQVFRFSTATESESDASSDAAPVDAADAADARTGKWSRVATGTQASFSAAFRTGPGDIWLAGSGGEILRWKNGAWVVVGFSSTKNRLAITGTAANDVWIVGDETLHNTGSGWVTVDAKTDRSLYGVSVGRGEDGWAIGTGGTILRFADNGSKPWSEGESPTTKWLRAIWLPNATAGFIVGAGGTTLALLNGTAWQQVPAGTVSADLLDVWGSASDDVWAVGEAATVLHWRGSAWSVVSVVGDAGTTSALRGVWGSGPKDVWAVGTGGTILHYNGLSWSEVATGAPYSLNDVWGSSATDVWAVGTGGTILHWDGQAWTPADSGTNASLNAVWGADAANVWAIGESGTILRHAAK